MVSSGARSSYSKFKKQCSVFLLHVHNINIEKFICSKLISEDVVEENYYMQKFGANTPGKG
jgi:hypothetical protein